MEFRTKYKILKGKFSLNPDYTAIFAGSCFSENISEKMRQSLWKGINPLGVLYNPMSILTFLKALLDKDAGISIFKNSIFESGGIFRSWLSDSKISGISEDECLNNFKCVKKDFLKNIENADALIITFGTAWYYILPEKSSNNDEYIVANCHKMPAAIFERKRLDIDRIYSEWSNMICELQQRYPRLKIIFTVSPIRHIKDGLSENFLSKSILRIALQSICENFDNCEYFPAYEILNDDLRDYRFYASDMVHPSETAIEYLWEIFKETYLDKDSTDLLKEGERIKKLYDHRSIMETMEMTETRKAKAIEMLKKLKVRHPGMMNLE